MNLFSRLFQRTTDRPRSRRALAGKPDGRVRPCLETLEGRDLPSFAAPVSYAGGPPAAPVVAADLRNHGTPDLLALGQTFTANNMYWNNGNGVFGSILAFYPVSGSHATALAVGDVNADGKTDVVLASTPSDPWGGISTYITVLTANGSGGLVSTGNGQGFSWGKITSLALADINRDGKMDLLTASSQGVLYVAAGAGNGLFRTTQTCYLGGFNGRVDELAVADINGDGKPDVVMTGAGGVSVLLNNGNGTLGTPHYYTVGGAPAAVALGDVTGDGKLDVVTANTNGTVSVLPGLGNGTFAAARTYAVGGPANTVALGDFTHDSRLDIATTGSAEMDVLFNNGGGFAAYQKVGPAGSGRVAADLNGDGSPDLAQIDAATGNLEVLLNNANWTSPSFVVAGFPASNAAGVAQNFTVTALNADGSVNTGYSGTVHFTSSDPQAVLPANSTLTNGVGTFQATLKTAGAQSITAIDTATGRITGNESGITVNALVAANLVFSYNQGGATAGGALYLILTAKDAYGNNAAGYAGTVHFTSSDPRAVLPDYTLSFSSSDGTATLPPDDTITHAINPGVFTFTNAVILKKKGVQTITFTDLTNPALTGTVSITVS